MNNLSRKKYIIILLIIVSVMTIGFAVLSTSLTLSGTTTVNANTWNVKFQNIQIDSSNNVTATTAPTISDNTSVDFAVALSKPGDKFSFTVDVVNTGSIDAMINTISKSNLTSAQETLLDYTVTYSDGIEIAQKDKLVKTSGSETIKVEILYDTDITEVDLPSSVINLNLTFGLKYVQADSTANVVGHSLEDFITLAKSGCSLSNTYVGKEFTVSLGTTYGDHTIRVANVSSPSECSESDFSGTACGVVLEFADIITNHNMNPSGMYKDVQYNSGWNVDGWPASSMRTFVNDDIYNVLPSNLKNAIIDTTVISGHGNTTGETNFTSTDKLYLLSTHEVMVDADNNLSNGIDYYDTSYNNTRQLDYYAGKNVTTTSYSDAIKNYNGNPLYWWLRSPGANSSNRFFSIFDSGACIYFTPVSSNGVSPAFRIA